MCVCKYKKTDSLECSCNIPHIISDTITIVAIVLGRANAFMRTNVT